MSAAGSDEAKAVWVLGHRGNIAPVLTALGPLVPELMASTTAGGNQRARIDYSRIQGEPYFASIDLEQGPSEEHLPDRPFDLSFAIVRAKDLAWWRSSTPALRFAQRAYRHGGVLVIGGHGGTTQDTTIEQVCADFGWSLERAPVFLSSVPFWDSTNALSQRSLRADLEHAMLVALHHQRHLLADEDAEFGAWCHSALQWKVLTDIWLRSAWELQAEVAIPRALVHRESKADIEFTWQRVLRRTHCAMRGVRGQAPDLRATQFRELYESSYQNAPFGAVEYAKGSGDERVAGGLALFTVALGMGYASLLREEEPVPKDERLLPWLVTYVRQASRALAMMTKERSLGNLMSNPFVRKNGHRFERANDFVWKYFEPMLELPEQSIRVGNDEPPAVLPEPVRSLPEGPAFTPEDLSRALQYELPITGGPFSLELGLATCSASPVALKATLQFVRMGNTHAGKTERDVWEEEVAFVPERHLAQPARVRAYVKGWADALREVLPLLHDNSFLMPHDFIDNGVLDLLRPNVADDFRRALLTKGRLGRLLRKEPSEAAEQAVASDGPSPRAPREGSGRR